ncbi:MAG: DUF3006 family protein [Bacillota bacterium]|nr:DUF3006 family protein [Bacillota bacterium]
MTKIEGYIERLTEQEALIVQLDRTREAISRSLLPERVQPGDFIVQVDATNFRIDQELTEKRRQELRRMTDCYLE